MKGPACKAGVKATMVRIHPPPQHRTQASVPERTKGPACKAGCQGFESLRWLQTCQREHRRAGRDRFNRDMFRGGRSSDRNSAGLWPRRAQVPNPVDHPNTMHPSHYIPQTKTNPRPSPSTTPTRCACSSDWTEHNLAEVGAAGSNPARRTIRTANPPAGSLPHSRRVAGHRRRAPQALGTPPTEQPSIGIGTVCGPSLGSEPARGLRHLGGPSSTACSSNGQSA